MIRTIIVEDEPLARDLLRFYVAMHGELELVGEAGDGQTGLLLVNELAPDLLLLDVRLPGLDGISLARQMRNAPAVVFITAYDRYAITAFELGAFDYLLKPVIPERFSLALRRIQERGSAKTTVGNVADRLSLLKSNEYLCQFVVRHQDSIPPVQVEDIVRLEADDDYTAIYTAGKRLMVHVPLRDLAARLSPDTFVRVHRCSVINLAHVQSSHFSDRRMFLQMSDKSAVRVSRTGMQALEDLRLKRQKNRH